MDDKKDKLSELTGAAFGIQKIEIDLNSFDKEPDLTRLPLLPTRNLVLFPGMTVTFELGRESARQLADYANQTKTPIGVVCQIDPDEDNPAVTTGLYKYGVVADVLSVLENENTPTMAIVRARGKFRILGTARTADAWLSAKVKLILEFSADDDHEFDTVIAEIRRIIKEDLNDLIPAPLMPLLKQIENNDEFVNYCCTNFPFDQKDKVDLLAKNKYLDRAKGLLAELVMMNERQKITRQIMNKTKKTMDENQRNAFLQQQMETIRETLYGDSSDEVDELLAAGEEARMPQEVWTLFQKEIEKLRRFNPSSPDYSVLYSYLDTLVKLPWHKQTAPVRDLEKARKILEDDHYGLDKVKERILEQLALIMHNPRGKSPIICLVGPPGVGKTSIGKSVAHALGRKYERVSFGGLHDEAEIRGHRRTYIGAMPGRIIDAMKRAGTVNPVLVLDELDKIGNDYKGDPAAALLEVLDPEQNCHFHDNYIDVDYDLSNVLFIATANTLSTIARPLIDRMEIIELPGYLVEEKVEIAQRHLLPRICRDLNLDPEKLEISNEALLDIIRNYTSESGVRTLDKQLAKVGRKAVMAEMTKSDFPSPVQPDDLYDLLGLAPHIPDKYEGNEFAGVVTGLAWTEVGGEILMAESSLALSKTPTLTLTGKLGDVMKESATIAYQWVKAHATQLGIDPALFDKYSLHIHFPEGAIPKDGPSAGITIATSIVSTFTQRRVAERIAMTGEITLRGKVLPVGGIREKILAAKRAGIDTIVLSAQNRRDIEDMPTAYISGMTFNFVDTVAEVIDFAITDTPVANPVEL
ncbi:MAG: endopeptidase La [Muribaculaceae bacterium]